jgi:hypothetical protein
MSGRNLQPLSVMLRALLRTPRAPRPRRCTRRYSPTNDPLIGHTTPRTDRRAGRTSGSRAGSRASPPHATIRQGAKEVDVLLADKNAVIYRGAATSARSAKASAVRHRPRRRVRDDQPLSFSASSVRYDAKDMPRVESTRPMTSVRPDGQPRPARGWICRRTPLNAALECATAAFAIASDVCSMSTRRRAARARTPAHTTACSRDST